jgi:hypothetical protein
LITCAARSPGSAARLAVVAELPMDAGISVETIGPANTVALVLMASNGVPDVETTDER